MAQIIFQQGEDLIVELPIVENSLPVDLTTATSMRVQLYITKNNVKNKFKSYSSTPKSGYGVCKLKTGTDHNIIQVFITRADSVNFDTGILSFAVVVTLPGLTDFPDGKNSEYNFDSFGTVVEGIAKDEIIP